jgi:hypothetical protein
VTGCAVRAEGDDYDRDGLWTAFDGVESGGKPVRIGDSKVVSGFQDMAGAEILVNGLARLLAGKPLKTADDFLRWVTLTPFENLCPAPSHSPCYTRDWDLPLFAPPDGFAERVDDLARAFEQRFQERGRSVTSVKSNIYCPFRYNAYFAHKPEARKSHLNFSAFEEVISHFHDTLGEQALFLCGKVMNLKYYTKYFEYLTAFDVLSKEETHLISQYALKGLGDIWFVHDGDRLDLPIALASIFGKYVRELYVFRVNRFFQNVFSDLKPASGYNDRVTKALIARAKPALADLSVDPSCFQRVK